MPGLCQLTQSIKESWSPSHTIICYTLKRLGEELAPVRVQGMQPRRIVFGLEVVGVLVGILLLHHLEAWHIEVGEVLSVLSRPEAEAVLLCHCGCYSGRD